MVKKTTLVGTPASFYWEQSKLFDTSGAVFSEDGMYRYLLWRNLGNPKRRVCFIMLNPSTADADENDPTVRRCLGFARDWGYGWVDVCNLFAYVSTSPTPILERGADLTGDPENIRTISRVAAGSQLVVAAWGAFKLPPGRCATVIRNVVACGPRQGILCLGLTATGAPRHPLYLAKNTEPIPFPLARDERDRIIAVGDAVFGTPNLSVESEISGVVTQVKDHRVRVRIDTVDPYVDGGISAGDNIETNAWVWSLCGTKRSSA